MHNPCVLKVKAKEIFSVLGSVYCLSLRPDILVWLSLCMQARPRSRKMFKSLTVSHVRHIWSNDTMHVVLFSVQPAKRKRNRVMLTFCLPQIARNHFDEYIISFIFYNLNLTYSASVPLICGPPLPSLMSCFAGMSQTEDFHSCALPLGFLSFAFGTCARSMLDLNFSMSHAVIADLISLQSLLARYPVALLKSR